MSYTKHYIADTSLVTIQGWMITRFHLSGQQLLMYAAIYGASQDGCSWFKGRREWLAEWCGVTKKSVTKYVQQLVEKGLIECRTVSAGRTHYNEYRAVLSVIPNMRSAYLKNGKNKGDNAQSGQGEESSLCQKQGENYSHRKFDQGEENSRCEDQREKNSPRKTEQREESSPCDADQGEESSLCGEGIYINNIYFKDDIKEINVETNGREEKEKRYIWDEKKESSPSSPHIYQSVEDNRKTDSSNNNNTGNTIANTSIDGIDTIDAIDSKTNTNPAQSASDISWLTADGDGMRTYDRKAVKENIQEHVSYSELTKEYPQEKVDIVTDTMTDMWIRESPTTYNGVHVSAKEVRERITHIAKRHLENILDKLIRNIQSIVNVRRYLETLIYNAPLACACGAAQGSYALPQWKNDARDEGGVNYGGSFGQTDTGFTRKRRMPTMGLIL